MQQFPLRSESERSHWQINFVLRCPTSLQKSFFVIKTGLLKIQLCLLRSDYSVAHQQRLNPVFSRNVLLPVLFNFCNLSFFAGTHLFVPLNSFYTQVAFACLIQVIHHLPKLYYQMYVYTFSELSLLAKPYSVLRVTSIIFQASC